MKTIYSYMLHACLKALVLVASFLLFFRQGKAQVCSTTSPNIFSLSNAGVIYPVNASNGTVGTPLNPTALGATSSANAIGYNTNNGLFYYFQNANNGSSQQFVSYNVLTNTYTTLAQNPESGVAYKGCVNFNGTGYYCLDSKSNLYYYNISANTWTLICNTFTDQNNANVTSIFTSEASGDIAIDGLGDMWIVASSGSKWGLYKLPAPLPTAPVPSISLKELVDPTTTTPTGVNFVGIAFDPLGNIYMATNNDLYLLQSAFVVTHLASFSTAGVCGDLTSCNFPIGVLALEWNSFTVDLANNAVMLDWVVSHASNVQGFYIERSSNNKDWEVINSVAFNQDETNYAAVDPNPVPGINLYRIREQDLNGEVSYSVTKTISLSGNTNISIWPNPVQTNVIVQNNGSDNNMKIEIFDELGIRMYAGILRTGNNSVNMGSFASGNYIIHLQSTDGKVYNKKILKKGN